MECAALYGNTAAEVVVALTVRDRHAGVHVAGALNVQKAGNIVAVDVAAADGKGIAAVLGP